MQIRLNLVSSVLVSLMLLSGCGTVSQVQQGRTNELQGQLREISLLMEDNNADGDIAFAIDSTNDNNVGAFARYDNRTIYLTKAMVKMFEEGKINRNQMMWIIGHELGHLSSNAKNMRGTMEEEIYCDMYSILLLDEMQHDGIPVDIYDAISYLKISPGRGDSLHPHPAQRYAELLIKLNDWELTKKHKPSAGA